MDIHRELFLMQQTYATLFSLSNKLQEKGDKYLEKITSRQYMTMLAITHLSEDKTTINNIAGKLCTTKQNVKQIVSVLEKRGLVKIISNPQDKRSVNVIITECGNEVMYEVAENGLLFMSDIFKDFSAEEIETLWNMLKKLYFFDGEKQDGFEAEGSLKATESQKAELSKALKKFEIIRKNCEMRHENYEK